MTKLFCIQNTSTKEIWQANSGKVGWPTQGGAKNAWNNSKGTLFKDQDKFKVINVLEKLQQLESILEGYDGLDCTSGQGVHCGVEDRGIHCRYEACDYGWESCVEAIDEIINV